jgi:hypothetical protein
LIRFAELAAFLFGEGKVIERKVISSYQIAQGLGFNGDYRAWEHLLRIRESESSNDQHEPFAALA